MKADIHPTYHDAITVKCACGNTFVTGSTVEQIDVEICAACHPFFTGKSKLMDAAGRVDKFKARLAQAEEIKSGAKPKKPRKNEVEPVEETVTAEAVAEENSNEE